MKWFWSRALPSFALLVAATVAASAQLPPPKEHQATGTVASASPTQLVILKKFGRNEAKWTFAVNLKTQVDAKPAKGMRVRISYHEERSLRIADRIRAASPSRTAAPADGKGASVPPVEVAPKAASPESPEK